MESKTDVFTSVKISWLSHDIGIRCFLILYGREQLGEICLKFRETLFQNGI